jgi:hypothetical protein
MNESKINATILYNLRRKKCIGAKHTALDTILSGFPRHLGSDVFRCASELIKSDLVIVKSTHYGKQKSLNPRKLTQIEELIIKDLSISFFKLNL